MKLLLDADLPKALATALRRRVIALDVLRAHDAGLGEAPDAEILDFAARHGRITASRDKATMRHLAGDRVKKGQPMSGLLVVRKGLRSVGPASGLSSTNSISSQEQVMQRSGRV